MYVFSSDKVYDEDQEIFYLESKWIFTVCDMIGELRLCDCTVVEHAVLWCSKVVDPKAKHFLM